METMTENGRTARITLSKVGSRYWNWRVDIEGEVLGHPNQEELAPSRAVALDEARGHARHLLQRLDQPRTR